jgi:hypothetical protein
MPTFRRVVGAVHAVPLNDSFAFCVTLAEADFVFFDYLSKSPGIPGDLVMMKQRFRIAVHKSAYNKGRWPRVGTISVPPALLKPAPTFMRDALNPNEYSIYLNGEIRPATREECIGLERMAVWEPEHIESRLSDHYAGRPNAWVQQLAIGEA